jgi:hypothetical protein
MPVTVTTVCARSTYTLILLRLLTLLLLLLLLQKGWLLHHEANRQQ